MNLNSFAEEAAAAAGESGQDLSILSIDMGIQNLAFAHLLVPGRTVTGTGVKDGRLMTTRPVLNAWHRIAVSALPACLDASSSNNNLPPEVFRTLTTNSENNRKKAINEDVTADEAEAEATASAAAVAAEEDLDESEGKPAPFSPDIYAAHAYTLLTSLIATYRPTHILIERQRFRSGGGPAIQEWTLRVGVFEGMLYAVLHTLRRLGKCAVEGVQDMDPKRIARYWEIEEKVVDSEENTTKKKTKKASPREVKKMKIDLVGRWLQAAREDAPSPSPSQLARLSIPSSSPPPSSNPPVKDVVDAFLHKWNGGKPRGTLHPKTRTPMPRNIDKLDDLADCLLQGMTWLEWQVMRGRLVREGLDALDMTRTGSIEANSDAVDGADTS